MRIIFRAQHTLHNEIKHVLQEIEKRKSDHDVVAGLTDQLVEKTNERVEKELSKVDLGLTGIRSTLKALSGRIDDIATRGIEAPTYAKATAASSAKGKEKEVHIKEPMKDPHKQPRAQTPAAEQTQGSGKEKVRPRDAKRPKDHATPNTVTTNVLDLSSVADWRQLRTASTLGEMAPGIKLSNAVAIAKGLQAPSAGSVTASLWSGVIPPPSTRRLTAVVPNGKNQAVQMGALSPTPPPFDKAKPKQKPRVHIKQGNARVHPRQIIVRSLTKSFIITGFTETMMTAACMNILTTEVGSANWPSSILLKKSEMDWWVTFINRPNDGEFEALKAELPKVIEARCSITAAEILVEHMWTLTKMAIRNVPLSWKDPVRHVWSSSYKPATPKWLVANAGAGAIQPPSATSLLPTAVDAVRSTLKSSTMSTRSVVKELASPPVALPLRPASQNLCKFWKHNQDKEWLARHAKEAESVDSQKNRTAKECKKLWAQFKKEADETRAAKERELGAGVLAALTELTGLEVEDPMQQDHT
ncbi:hypothetical protein DAEQUDRAFT_765920 [Daedalea quercina L-15889]|uniref:Uncharacterized protein n=1 Tax=Daedalea quercina L-15889 TaxID=1314783 RepID=A0A165Q283_9APHY|nr:hypothetical protein DAEQUDRAFT_765920 [Daedalea quercina L-15889]